MPLTLKEKTRKCPSDSRPGQLFPLTHVVRWVQKGHNKRWNLQSWSAMTPPVYLAPSPNMRVCEGGGV